MKRIAAIHDMSCFGRCALTVVIPILSSMGHQVIPVPTALLSTHTGGFEHPYFRDLSTDMNKITDHFESLGVTFDGIYSGFLGSVHQIDIVSDIIDRFGSGVPVLVDPVMGDDGSLYSTYTEEMMRNMGRLCKKADIITPNITEAHFLTGIELPQTIADRTSAEYFADSVCRTIRDMYGTEKIVITGIHYGDKLANACFENGALSLVVTDRLERSFPGTGEVFASVLMGEICGGANLKTAAEKATEFSYAVIKHSQQSAQDTRNGVLLEDCLYMLTPQKRSAENNNPL